MLRTRAVGISARLGETWIAKPNMQNRTDRQILSFMNDPISLQKEQTMQPRKSSRSGLSPSNPRLDFVGRQTSRGKTEQYLEQKIAPQTGVGYHNNRLQGPS